MTQETEIKLRVESPEHAAELLRGAGFSVDKPRLFERNLIFDTEHAALKSSRRMLRLREAGSKATVTFKGPGQPGKHKSREEREVNVEDFGKMQIVLERLGYRVTFGYDKHRTEYTRAGEDGTATIDETPVGTFMELEGEADWIDETAARLGFQESDYITASYASLYTKGRSAGDLD